MDIGFRAREPRPFGASPEVVVPRGKKILRDASWKTCVGDLMARFHNPGGLGNPGRRKAYLKEVLRGIQILGVCELAVESEAELEKELRWEHACEVVMGGYRGRNTGLALIVKMSVDGRHLTKRRDGAQHGMQILIVDIEIKGYKFRFVLTHAPPQTDLVLKTEYFFC